MSERQALPTVLRGQCADCETEVELRHPDGLGGAGLGWACLVCAKRVLMCDAPTEPRRQQPAPSEATEKEGGDE